MIFCGLGRIVELSTRLAIFLSILVNPWWNLLNLFFYKLKGILFRYFSARNDCERVADSLNKAGIGAIAYHAGLSDEQRTQCQEAWINGRYKVSQLILFL